MSFARFHLSFLIWLVKCWHGLFRDDCVYSRDSRNLVFMLTEWIVLAKMSTPHLIHLWRSGGQGRYVVSPVPQWQLFRFWASNLLAFRSRSLTEWHGNVLIYLSNNLSKPKYFHTHDLIHTVVRNLSCTGLQNGRIHIVVIQEPLFFI